MLEKRKLGGQGLEVSAIGLGCMGMSHAYGTPKRRSYLEENLRAASLQLTEEEIDMLDAATGPQAVSGARYNDGLLALVDR